MNSNNNDSGNTFKSVIINLLMLLGIVALIAGVLIILMNGGI